MALWLSFLFWLGATIVQALLVKPKIENARPSGLDDFQVPTATEGRAVPIIFGKVKMAGPNVIWYGDLSTRAITEEVGGFLGIGGTDVTKGYQYFLGLQMAVCRGEIDGIDRVWFADKVISSGEKTGEHSVTFTDLEFFGGEERGGGVDFTLDFYPGSDTQPIDPYIATVQTPVTAYRRTAYYVLTNGSGGGGYIGNAANLRNFAFEPFWYPNSLGATGGAERIGEDANPICCLYELLVNNDDWGLEMPSSDVLITGTSAQGALRALAEDIAAEGLGFSMVLDRELPARDLIKEIERHVDGAFRLDLTDGRFKIILGRPPVGAVPTLDESNIIEVRNFARPTWAETKNEVRIGFSDRTKEYNQTFAFDYDAANRIIVGDRRNIATLNFPGIKNATVANQIAARELRGLAFPLAKLSVRVSGALYTLQKGDSFDWSWEDYGITGLGMRVIKVTYDDDQSGEITLDAVEDIYRLETAGFVDPPATGWTPPAVDAVDSLVQRIWEPPTRLRASTGLGVVMLVARNGGLHLDYDLYVDFDGGTDNFELTNAAINSWTPVALLNGALDADLDGPPDYTGTVLIDNLVDANFGTLTAAANTTVDEGNPVNVLLVGDELMWYEGVTDNLDGTLTLTGVRRGAFGTVPSDHADDARVWFPTQGAGLLLASDSQQTLAAAQDIRAKVVTRTSTGALDIASASPVPLAADYTITGPYAYEPRDVTVNTLKFVDDDWTATVGLLELTWKGTNSQGTDFDTTQDDAHEVPESGVGYNVRIFRRDTNVVVQQFNGLPAGSQGGAYTAFNYVPADANDIPETDQFGIELEAVKAGTLGPQLWSRDFTIKGYGFDYGGTDADSIGYGGSLVEGSATVRGEAPDVIEPLPGLDTGRQSTLVLSGTFNSDEDLFVSVSFSNNIAGTSTTESYAIRGSAVTSLAGYISALRDEIVDDFPEELVVNTDGSTLRLITFFGNISIDVDSSVGSAEPRLIQEPISPQAGRPGFYWIDFFRRGMDSFGEFDELAPSTADDYVMASDSASERGEYSFGISAQTLELRRALDFDTTRSVRFRQPMLEIGGLPTGVAPPQNYAQALDRNTANVINFIDDTLRGAFEQFLADNADTWGQVIQDVRYQIPDLGIWTADGPAQTRPSVVVITRPGYVFSAPEYVELVEGGNTPAGNSFSLLMRNVLSPLAELPSGLAQTTSVEWSGGFDPVLSTSVDVVAGITLSVTFKDRVGHPDATYSYVTGAADTGAGRFYDNGILQLCELIDPVEVAEDPLDPSAPRQGTGDYLVTGFRFNRRSDGLPDGPMVGTIPPEGFSTPITPERAYIRAVEFTASDPNESFTVEVSVSSGLTFEVQSNIPINN